MRRHLLSAPVAKDLPDLCALLAGCGLPCSDLTAGHLPGFLICRDGARLLATAGLEPCGEALLLRSLAVAATHRRLGLGSQLVSALEQHALASGRRTLFLLTITAAGFFSARGYTPLDRRLVPAAVAETAEFRSLCPASAICLHKTLAVAGSP